MFSSELPLTLDIPDDEDQQVIHYINALPGAGKTWVFDNRIAKYHVQEQHNSLLVYAAPTSKLLLEREQALLGMGIDKDKVMVITSDSIPSGMTVAEAFRQAVVGSKTAKGRPNGSIILCTHECVARVSESMRGRDRVVMIYDEARACLQDNYALHLPDDVFKYLTEPGEHYTEDGRKVKQRLLSKVSVFESGDGDDSEFVYIWKWSNSLIPLPTNARLQEFLPKSVKARTKAESILDFLRNIHSSSLDVYVSITRRKTKTSTEYVISNVFSPSRMFRGYAKVLILSAFFETSQMYHFLAKGGTKLKDITKANLSEKRMRKLLKRLQYTRMTYIYDLGKRTLSKSDMQQGLVLESQIDSETLKKINKAWYGLYPTKPEFYRTVYDTYHESGDRAQRMTDTTRVRSYKLMDHLHNCFNILGGVIPHMVDTSIRLQQAFMVRMGLPTETLPIGINPRYTSYREGEAAVWVAERLDDFNKRTKLYEVPKNGQILMQLPITAHGLNAYKELHSCAFLAAMKYSPREAKFMDRALTGYDPRIDRTLDYALQLLWRCNVRMPEKDPVLLIVTDVTLARELQSRFRKLADYWLGDHDLKLLPIIDPKKLIKDYSSPSVLRYTFNPAESQKQRDADWRTSTKGKEVQALKKLYLKTPDGSQYNRLTANISYAKRNGNDFSKLEAQRKKLQTFAQWKTSSEGVVARQSMSITFDKIKAAKDALARLDSSKLKARNEVLKIVSVIKREAPELKAAVKEWYPGDNFEHNWKTAEDYGTRYNLGWLFAQAQKHSK